MPVPDHPKPPYDLQPRVRVDCRDCGWVIPYDTDPAVARREARKHSRSAGSVVLITVERSTVFPGEPD